MFLLSDVIRFAADTRHDVPDHFLFESKVVKLTVIEITASLPPAQTASPGTAPTAC